MTEGVRSTVAYTKERVTNYNFDGLFRRVNVIYIRESRRSLLTYEQLGIVDPTFRSACEKIVLWCQVAVSVEFLGKRPALTNTSIAMRMNHRPCQPGNICIFELVNGLMHVLLIVYLLFFTSVSQTSLSWLKLGYFLTAYFLSEAIVRILVRLFLCMLMACVCACMYVLHVTVGVHRVGHRRAELLQKQRLPLPVWTECAVLRLHGRDGVEHQRHWHVLPPHRADAVC